MYRYVLSCCYKVKRQGIKSIQLCIKFCLSAEQIRCVVMPLRYLEANKTFDKVTTTK